MSDDTARRMIEAVAKAICSADGEPWEELNEDDNGKLVSFPGDRRYYRDLAQAAIAALGRLRSPQAESSPEVEQAGKERR